MFFLITVYICHDPQIEKKRNNSETNFNSSRPPEMLEEIEALKKKTEMNREQAEQAKADVITALGSATNTKEVRCVCPLTNHY